MDRASTIRKHAHWIALGVLVLGLAFYLYRIDQWFMHDDEGGYCYAAWRITQGEVPYRDFLTPQLPLFLYWGGTVVKVFGPSIMALRYATVFATLCAGWFVYLAVRQALDWRVALLSLPLFLLHKDIYFIARFFRPEAYMLMFVAVAVYVLILSYQGRRHWGFVLSGVLFGLATLCKLFAVLAFGGGVLYLLCRWLRWRERWVWRPIVALCAGFIVSAGAVFIAFQAQIPYFLTAVLGHHAMQGAELTATQVIGKTLRFYVDYFRGNPGLAVLAILGALRAYQLRAELAAVFVWQIPTAAAFLLLSRDLQDRHLVYLVPVLSAFAAFALQAMLVRQTVPTASSLDEATARRETVAWSSRLLLGVLLLGMALWPSWQRNLQVAGWEDGGTHLLAQYIQAHSLQDDLVLCDYPGLNFHAQRSNTYLGAGLSGGATSSGQISGAALIEEIETHDVRMVLVNVAGGAHQLVNLRDYADFRRYLQSHFHLIRMFNRSYQAFEIYHRDEHMPLLPEAEFGGKLTLTGADLGTAAGQAGQEITVTLRWQALTAMDRDYTVSLRLVDESGHRYGQQDTPLLRTFTARWEGPREIIEQAPTSQWVSGEVVMDAYQVSVPHGTPPGGYELTALVYSLATGEVLLAQDGSDSAAAAEYVLGSIEVASPKQPPALDELPIHREVMHHFGGQLQLLGHGPIVDQVRPGDSLHLVLFWRSLRYMEGDWELLVRVLGADGRVVAESQCELANPSHPTSRWVPGEVVLGRHDLTLDRSAPTGEAQIMLDLVDATTGKRLLGHDWVLAVFSTEGRARQFEVPDSMQHPLTANFGNRVLLLGYDLDTADARPGGLLTLRLHWQALAKMDTSHTVFTHLLDGQERIWGQKDSLPVQGTYPTTAWLPGEVVTDVYEIDVLASTPAGAYIPEVGLYNAATGERLQVIDSAGHIVADRVLLAPVEITE